MEFRLAFIGLLIGVAAQFSPLLMNGMLLDVPRDPNLSCHHARCSLQPSVPVGIRAAAGTSPLRSESILRHWPEHAQSAAIIASSEYAPNYHYQFSHSRKHPLSIASAASDSIH